MLGKTRDLIPDMVKKPVDHHPSWTTSPLPNDGNHLSSTANNHMSKTPIRKVGNDTPMRDVDKIKLAIKPPRLIAV